jgi:hypothetical protein
MMCSVFVCRPFASALQTSTPDSDSNCPVPVPGPAGTMTNNQTCQPQRAGQGGKKLSATVPFLTHPTDNSTTKPKDCFAPLGAHAVRPGRCSSSCPHRKNRTVSSFLACLGVLYHGRYGRTMRHIVAVVFFPVFCARACWPNLAGTLGCRRCHRTHTHRLPQCAAALHTGAWQKLTAIETEGRKKKNLPAGAARCQPPRPPARPVALAGF